MGGLGWPPIDRAELECVGGRAAPGPLRQDAQQEKRWPKGLVRCLALQTEE